MDFDWIWKAVLIVLVGTILLRFAGRKTISQMTLAETVIMIGIGSLMIQPVAGENIWITFAVGFLFVLTLIILEYVQVKSDKLEKMITGKSKILIQNGQLHEKNLVKLRMTVDQLEMNLRQQNVSKISDVEWATLEPNGQVGFSLKQEAQPVTKREFQQLQQSIDTLLLNHGQKPSTNYQPPTQNQQQRSNLFQEVNRKEHRYTPPDHLQ
mgnify:FL=1